MKPTANNGRGRLAADRVTMPKRSARACNKIAIKLEIIMTDNKV